MQHRFCQSINILSFVLRGLDQFYITTSQLVVLRCSVVGRLAIDTYLAVLSGVGSKGTVFLEDASQVSLIQLCDHSTQLQPGNKRMLFNSFVISAVCVCMYIYSTRKLFNRNKLAKIERYKASVRLLTNARIAREYLALSSEPACLMSPIGFIKTLVDRICL